MKILKSFITWIQQVLLGAERIQWEEKPYTFIKALQNVLRKEAGTYLDSVEIQINQFRGITKLSGQAIITLSDGRCEFYDYVYFDGQIKGNVLTFGIRCDSLYGNSLPQMTSKLQMNNKVFSGVTKLTKRFKQSLDSVHQSKTKHRKNK